MKKIAIAAAVICIAAISQAATFDWVSTSVKLYGVTAANVMDNGTYAAATTGTDNRADKVCTLTYLLTILDGDTVIGTATGDVKYGTLGKLGTTGMEVAAAQDGKTYNYVLTLTGTQSNLSGRGVDGDFDYSGATLTAEISGTVTTASMGGTLLPETAPSSWIVSGVTAVPEPTSGLLMLVGLGALALRRKRA